MITIGNADLAKIEIFMNFKKRLAFFVELRYNKLKCLTAPCCLGGFRL